MATTVALEKSSWSEKGFRACGTCAEAPARGSFSRDGVEEVGINDARLNGHRYKCRGDGTGLLCRGEIDLILKQIQYDIFHQTLSIGSGVSGKLREPRFENIPIIGYIMNGKKEVKPLFWVGSSKNDLREFPEDVQDAMGYALHHAQIGEKHKNAKPLQGFGGPVFWR